MYFNAVLELVIANALKPLQDVGLIYVLKQWL